jgi:hypothetical protein
VTTGKISALTLGLIGSFALGVLAGPTFWPSQVPLVDPPVSTTVAAPSAMAVTPPATGIETAALSATAEPVQAHARRLLAQGTDVTKASDGFRDAEQFVTVAYAAKNTNVPFILLKQRVLEEKKSLAAAIQISKPDLNGALEAERARAEARADLARLLG